jgi:hypothetical protein
VGRHGRRGPTALVGTVESTTTTVDAAASMSAMSQTTRYTLVVGGDTWMDLRFPGGLSNQFEPLRARS